MVYVQSMALLWEYHGVVDLTSAYRTTVSQLPKCIIYLLKVVVKGIMFFFSWVCVEVSSSFMTVNGDWIC